MAHGESLRLAKIPPNRFYNYQPIGAFRLAGPQVEKRERMAARAEKRDAKGMKPKKGRKARAVSHA